MTQKFLLVEEAAKLIKQIQCKHIHIVCGTDQIRFKLLYLLTNVILFLCRILVDEKVIKQVAIFRILESRTPVAVITILFLGCFLYVLNFVRLQKTSFQKPWLSFSQVVSKIATGNRIKMVAIVKHTHFTKYSKICRSHFIFGIIAP